MALSLINPKNPTEADIKTLQAELAVYMQLAHPGQEAPVQTGKMDDDTTKAWKQFKIDGFVDGQLSLGYIKARWPEEHAKLVDEKKLDPDFAKFDRNKPPVAAVELVREKLGLGDAAITSAEFQRAVKKDKRDNWADAQLNPGAFKSFDDAQKEFSTITGGFAAIAQGDRGTGAALVQQYLGIKVDGMPEGATKKAIMKKQEQINEHREAEGLPPLKVDGVMGMQTYLAFKVDGFNLQAEQDKLAKTLEEKPLLAAQLKAADSVRAEMTGHVFGGDSAEAAQARAGGAARKSGGPSVP